MSQKPETKPTSRRSFFAGAAAVGVATAAVTTLPAVNAPTTAANTLPPAPDNGGGYSLSEHVKRYYKTARV
jgi:anaerobic selenocysteine-containing dehydrogenase